MDFTECLLFCSDRMKCIVGRMHSIFGMIVGLGMGVPLLFEFDKGECRVRGCKIETGSVSSYFLQIRPMVDIERNVTLGMGIGET